MIPVPAASGPAMPVLQALRHSACFAKRLRLDAVLRPAVVLPAHVLPSSAPPWVPVGATTSCSSHTFRGESISTHSSSFQFNSFLGKVLVEIFIGCMVESRLTYLPINHFLYWALFHPCLLQANGDEGIDSVFLFILNRKVLS